MSIDSTYRPDPLAQATSEVSAKVCLPSLATDSKEILRCVKVVKVTKAHKIVLAHKTVPK